MKNSNIKTLTMVVLSSLLLTVTANAQARHTGTDRGNDTAQQVISITCKNHIK